MDKVDNKKQTGAWYDIESRVIQLRAETDF